MKIECVSMTRNQKIKNISQITYDRQSEGTDQSQNLVSRGSSNITPETDRMAATYLLQLRDTHTHTESE